MTLETVVFKFRKAIEAAKANHEPGYFFEKFPFGQCGNASDMLAQFLIDKRIGPIKYVNGIYYSDDGQMQSHTWLVVDDRIVDITGDQFKNRGTPLAYNIPVYIGPITKYYQLFNTTYGSIHTHIGLEKQWTNYYELRSWYETILRYLK